MIRWGLAVVLGIAIVAPCGATARAETWRVAIVVGNNAGNEGEALHYAETDADKLANVLRELGGVAPDDLFLLQGKPLAALDRTFARATQRIAELHRDPTSHVILIFYFSGHSDGEALELGADRLPYAQLRRQLGATSADIRVVLVDSCKSGALVAVKGGHRGAAFQIRLTDDVASSGEALLTSSAADEVSLESREIGGSFFTHHFVSGLRGLADTSGDGIVTLSEAYQYAYAHTIVTTGATTIGTQHPTYDYQLSGQGDLVLTVLAKQSAALALPKGLDRGLVIDLARDQVIAEIASDVRPVIVVRPGSYAIRAWHDGKVVGGRVTVAANETRTVSWSELSASDPFATQSKGVVDDAVARATASIGGGVTGGVSDGLGAIPSLRAEVRWPSGLALVADASTKLHAGVRETSSALLAGYRRGVEYGRIDLWLGADLGLGLVHQASSAAAVSAGAAVAEPIAGGSVRVAHGVALGVDAAFPLELLRRDGSVTVVTTPAGWASVIFAF